MDLGHLMQPIIVEVAHWVTALFSFSVGINKGPVRTSFSYNNYHML